MEKHTGLVGGNCMRIVVLDGFTLNPGDLQWDPLYELGECTIHDRTSPELVVARSAEAGIILTNKVVLTRDHILQLPTLKYIGVLATGYNVVDIGGARERGIVVTNVPSYGTDSVAQLVFAHILNLTHAVETYSLNVRGGRWSASPDFSYQECSLQELAGLTMGIVGLGTIGRAVARIAEAFGMCVIATGGTPSDVGNVMMVPIDEVFRESDIVSLHCPLTEQTRNLVNRQRIGLMKPSALLINTARGQLVDEQALADALNGGMIGGAGVDVLSTEPPLASNPLLSAKHCCLTPHIGWATLSARRRLLAIAIANIRAFLAGSPDNVVS
jgi:glycerate dehydrogenase